MPQIRPLSWKITRKNFWESYTMLGWTDSRIRLIIKRNTIFPMRIILFFGILKESI